VTAGTLSSTNSNVREIRLGASTVTLSGNVFLEHLPTLLSTQALRLLSSLPLRPQLTAATRLFTACLLQALARALTPSTNPTPSTACRSRLRASANLRQVALAGDQTITGTLTAAGATAVRRVMLRSSAVGTTRTLTVGTLSADDCDFRDITIAGTAAGGSPTRAGDCGGNSGVTFPAPKTVYWNLAGSQNWSADGWATTSGGVPATNNFPLAQDTAVFDDTGSAGTVTVNALFNIGAIDMSARTSAMTLQGNTGYSIYGNWTFGSGVTHGGTATITFSGRGTSTITSAGKTFSGGITIDCGPSTVQLADALDMPSTRTLSQSSGTFDAVSYNVTTGRYNASGTPTLKMGSGTWTLSGTATVWDFGSTAYILHKGTADILLSNTTTSTRSFNGGGFSYNKLTIGGATGTSTLTITSNNQFTELASTKTVAHTIALGTTTQTFGKWSVTGTAGNVVTLTGTGTAHQSLQALAQTASTTLQWVASAFLRARPAEFYAGANSTATGSPAAVRPILPTSLRTAHATGSVALATGTTRLTGPRPLVALVVLILPRSHDDVVFDSSSNATDYTATVNAITGGNRCKALTIAGPASGNVTLAGSTALFIHDDITLPATGLTRTYTGQITLSGTGVGKTITTNGVALAECCQLLMV
jgi:hypothetical protein